VIKEPVEGSRLITEEEPRASLSLPPKV